MMYCTRGEYANNHNTTYAVEVPWMHAHTHTKGTVIIYFLPCTGKLKNNVFN